MIAPWLPRRFAPQGRSSRDVPDPSRRRSRRLVGRLRPAHDRGWRVQDAALARADERRTGGADHERRRATSGLGSRQMGTTLVFISGRSGKSQPWLLPLAGGEPRAARRVLRAGRRSGVVARRNRRIAVLAESGEERFRVGDPEQPTARRITDLNWRLDGIGIRDQFTSLWVVPARGGKPEAADRRPATRSIQRLLEPGRRRIGVPGRPAARGGSPRAAAGLVDARRRRPRHEARRAARRDRRCGVLAARGKLAYVGLDDPSFVGCDEPRPVGAEGGRATAARRGARPHLLLHRHRRPASTSARWRRYRSSGSTTRTSSCP